MAKVKVVEINVAKLDPNAIHLIVFHAALLAKPYKNAIAAQLRELGVKAIYAESINPESALKIYEIPRERKSKS